MAEVTKNLNCAKHVRHLADCPACQETAREFRAIHNRWAVEHRAHLDEYNATHPERAKEGTG
jgi:anti-sigma factor RsiW